MRQQIFEDILKDVKDHLDRAIEDKPRGHTVRLSLDVAKSIRGRIEEATRRD